MKSIETSGKTVEDAIKASLKELGCDLADVDIDVLETGSPGLFGMFGKLARVRVSLKEADTFSADMPVLSLDEPVEKKPAPPKKPSPKPESRIERANISPEDERPKPVRAKPETQLRHEEARPAGESHNAHMIRGEKVGHPSRPIDPAPISVSMADLPELDESRITESGKIALEFLRNVTRLMGVETEIRLEEKDGQMQAQMIGDNMGVLIGRRGDTLDALQYLTSLQVNKGREDYLRVTLDTEHYRAKRADALMKLADRMAGRVKKTGHRVALEPMNPYERRILHSALQAHPYVTTHSEGEEPYRRVIITLK